MTASQGFRPVIGNNVSDTLSSSIAVGASSIPVNTISRWGTGIGKVIVDRGTANEEIYLGTGISGSSITVDTNATTYKEGTTQVGHDAGATIESVPTAGDVNDAYDAWVTEHEATGAHKAFNPKVTTSINDANGNEVIKTPATTSAVNEVTVTNSATGNAVQLSATGGDTDISLNLVSKGTGTIQANGTAVSTAVKASGAEITTGTDDAKFATAKALADAGVNTRLASKIISVSRNMTAATGSVGYTGVGFTPTSLVFIGWIEATHSISINVVDSARGIGSIFSHLAANMGGASGTMYMQVDGSNYQGATVTSFDADGFTLSWTKTGSPTGTAVWYVLCFK